MPLSTSRNHHCWLASACLLTAHPVIAQQAPNVARPSDSLPAAPISTTAEAPLSTEQIDEIVVTAERRGLIGTAITASQGVVVNDELALTPAFRPGQLLETVPGLDVTSHSGEGKANQYLMRGYNLDHGTDLGVFVDGMPINEVTHAHGQGYTDLNFMIPELATNIHYTKGTYYAPEGDFSSVGSVRLSYLNHLEPIVSASVGTLGFERLFSAGSVNAGEGLLLGAIELQHYDGPWDSPDDQRKVNAVLRYSSGDDQNGYSVSGMFYHGLWNSTTDQPERAMAEELIGRFGSLNPSDGGQAQRVSLSAQYYQRVSDGQLTASAFAISNALTLWNDFTHFLVDPVNGDQEAQHEQRITLGGAVSYARTDRVWNFDSDWIGGAILRTDVADVSRLPTLNRQTLPETDSPAGFGESDHVRIGAVGVYLQATTHWNAWFRSVLGLREDYQYGSDAGTNPGTANAALFQPKGSLIFTPVDTSEFYVSAGRGFHSDDLRGVNQGRNSGVGGAPLIARQTGAELGLRQQVTPRATLTVALFNLDAQSETTYNPDVGQDMAGPASRRRGVEINLTYQVMRWLELYGTYAASHARFTTPNDDGTGHIGEYIPNSPFATGSFNLYVKDLGAWSGGLEYRYLGAFPLSTDNQIQGHGYGEWNGQARYAFGGWIVGVGVYNLLNIHADAAEFWYIDRLNGEPAAGVADVHVHPLEPRSVRLNLSKRF